MLPSFLLALREGLEAALVIGITLGVLAKTRNDTLKPAVWRGVAAALLVSLVVALLLHFIGAQFEGRLEEVFEAITMLGAALLLTWMIFWMHRQGASLRTQIEHEVNTTAARRGALGLFILAFLAVAREGVELSLFLTATALSSNALLTLFGALLGLASAALLGYALFTSTRRLNLKQFFRITNVLLVLFAAGLVAHGVHELNEASLIPAVIEHVWDTSLLLPENSALGQVLTALFGYNANPSLTEILAYLGYFGVLWLVIYRSRFVSRWQTSRATT